MASRKINDGHRTRSRRILQKLVRAPGLAGDVEAEGCRSPKMKALLDDVWRDEVATSLAGVLSRPGPKLVLTLIWIRLIHDRDA
jgi:hypothetical protein